MDKISCKLVDWNLETLEYDLALINELYGLASRVIQRVADFWLYPTNPRGPNVVSLPLARMPNMPNMHPGFRCSD